MSNNQLPSTNHYLPLIAIVGPTASGKTSLAIELAKQYGGEIICADSRTVYKGMDIGTAKPSLEERSQVPHWGLDIVTPDQSFSVAEFQTYARQKIAEIRARGHIPFLVGGTGLYIDAVLYSYTFSEKVDARLVSQGLTRAGYTCNKNNDAPVLELSSEPVVLGAGVRSISGEAGRSPLEANSCVVGIATYKKTLEQRIAERTEHMFENGVVQEAIMLGEKYGWESAAMTGNAYPLVRLYHDKVLDKQSTIDRITTLDRQLAKRQMTWFRRNPDIMWAQLAEASRYVERLLARG